MYIFKLHVYDVHFLLYNRTKYELVHHLSMAKFMFGWTVKIQISRTTLYSLSNSVYLLTLLLYIDIQIIIVCSLIVQANRLSDLVFIQHWHTVWKACEVGGSGMNTNKERYGELSMRQQCCNKQNPNKYKKWSPHNPPTTSTNPHRKASTPQKKSNAKTPPTPQPVVYHALPRTLVGTHNGIKPA